MISLSSVQECEPWTPIFIWDKKIFIDEKIAKEDG